MRTKYTFTLNATFDRVRDRLALLKCIRWVIYKNLPLADCIRLTDRMIFGEPIEIDRYFSKDTVFPSFFDVVAHKEADPNEEYQNQLTHKMDLLAAGANGDAAAAIAYCKLISDNEEYVC